MVVEINKEEFSPDKWQQLMSLFEKAHVKGYGGALDLYAEKEAKYRIAQELDIEEEEAEKKYKKALDEAADEIESFVEADMNYDEIDGIVSRVLEKEGVIEK